jgi:hypothetical protein
MTPAGTGRALLSTGILSGSGFLNAGIRPEGTLAACGGLSINMQDAPSTKMPAAMPLPNPAIRGCRSEKGAFFAGAQAEITRILSVLSVGAMAGTVILHL